MRCEWDRKMDINIKLEKNKKDLLKAMYRFLVRKICNSGKYRKNKFYTTRKNLEDMSLVNGLYFDRGKLKKVRTDVLKDELLAYFYEVLIIDGQRRGK